MAHQNFYMGIDLNSNTLEGLSAGVNGTDAVNKTQMDEAVATKLGLTDVRKEFLAVNLTDNTPYTVNHALGQKYVGVVVVDSNDELIDVKVVYTDADNLTVESTVALTGVKILVSL